MKVAFNRKTRGRLKTHQKAQVQKAVDEGASAKELERLFGLSPRTAKKYIKQGVTGLPKKEVAYERTKEALKHDSESPDHLSLREAHLEILDKIGKNEDEDIDTRIRASTAVIRTAPEEAAEPFSPPADKELRIELFRDLLEGETPEVRRKVRETL